MTLSEALKSRHRSLKMAEFVMSPRYLGRKRHSPGVQWHWVRHSAAPMPVQILLTVSQMAHLPLVTLTALPTLHRCPGRLPGLNLPSGWNHYSWLPPMPHR